MDLPGCEGALTPLAGSPYIFTPDATLRRALNSGAERQFLIQGGAGFHGVGNFTVYPRWHRRSSEHTADAGNGCRGPCRDPASERQVRLCAQYVIMSLGRVHHGRTGNPTPALNVYGQGQDMTVDTSGKFLVVVDITGVVHIFAIDPATGSMNQIARRRARERRTGMAMDPRGVCIWYHSRPPHEPGRCGEPDHGICFRCGDGNDEKAAIVSVAERARRSSCK